MTKCLSDGRSAIHRALLQCTCPTTVKAKGNRPTPGRSSC